MFRSRMYRDFHLNNVEHEFNFDITAWIQIRAYLVFHDSPILLANVTCPHKIRQGESQTPCTACTEHKLGRFGSAYRTARLH